MNEKPTHITEEEIKNIPIPEIGHCSSGVSSIKDRFPGTEVVVLPGPLHYRRGEEMQYLTATNYHAIAETPSGRVIDLCRRQGQRVFENLTHYFEVSGITFDEE